jgi:hypothetical protein
VDGEVRKLQNGVLHTAGHGDVIHLAAKVELADSLMSTAQSSAHSVPRAGGTCVVRGHRVMTFPRALEVSREADEGSPNRKSGARSGRGAS